MVCHYALKSFPHIILFFFSSPAQSNYNELIRIAVAIRAVVNEEIYVFALMYAFLNRQDTRNNQLPPVEEVLPYWYFPSTIINEADHRVKEAETEEVCIWMICLCVCKLFL